MFFEQFRSDFGVVFDEEVGEVLWNSAGQLGMEVTLTSCTRSHVYFRNTLRMWWEHCAVAAGTLQEYRRTAVGIWGGGTPWGYVEGFPSYV